ncbi:MAG: asparagine synthetase B [Bacteroidales bacterium]|nr:asparagine synthetase B [Bacteroidales bacterium]
MRKCCLLWILLFSLFTPSRSAQLLVPMDEAQTNHLKAYGVAYWVLQNGGQISWWLNYRGGSFLLPYSREIESECAVRDVRAEVLSDAKVNAIRLEIGETAANMDEVPLQKAPRIAVYSPKNKLPWDDAVTLVLTYAEIPYDVVYDQEVLSGVLPAYDWLHLHHEDFTGQFGKFWGAYGRQAWYREDERMQKAMAEKHGFSKVSQLKLAVAHKIRDFVMGGGFLFAMCSAPDSYDVALAAEGVDICDVPFDGDPMSADAQRRLDFSKTFAFRDFKIVTDPYLYEISDIDVTLSRPRTLNEKNDFFSLFDFSAKWDWIPTMLCQNHERVIHGFMGQTTAFRRDLLKPGVTILGQNESLGEARYIHGTYGKGTWTFLGGHDPEDYQHFVGDPHTDLNLYPHSPGYRLILNNILFPAAKKEKHKT